MIKNIYTTLALLFITFIGFAQNKLEDSKYYIDQEELHNKALWLNIPVVTNEGDEVLHLLDITENNHPIYIGLDNVTSAETIAVDKVWPSAGKYNLTGIGVTAGVWDGGSARSSHQEFTGRLSNFDNSGFSDHATHVSGTIAAEGIDPDARGMAYESIIRAYDNFNDLPEMEFEASNGLLLSNHSYGPRAGWRFVSGRYRWFGDDNISSEEDYKFGYYDARTAQWDDLCFNFPNYLPVKSAGNHRGDGPADPGERQLDGGADGFDCLSGYTNAKNILTVGATEDIEGGYTQPSDVQITSFSSFGPTDDGRIKPDVVANGAGLYSPYSGFDTEYESISGTSMSTPSATGALALMHQLYAEVFNEIPTAATMKALMIHTTDEAGEFEGPDYAHGWGLINTERAADVLVNHESKHSIIEASLVAETNYTRNFTLKAGDTVRATLVWTDLPGTPAAISLNPTDLMLVNDLDLRIENTTTQEIFYPYVLDPSNPAAPATKNINFRDNVEQVFFIAPSNGSYELIIDHQIPLAAQGQNFSLVVSRNPLECDDFIDNFQIDQCGTQVKDVGEDLFYFNNLVCDHLISLNQSEVDTIVLNFDLFDVRNGDMLLVYSSPNLDTQNLVGAYTGNIPNLSVKIPGSVAYTRFVTDSSNAAQGWSFEVDCIKTQISSIYNAELSKQLVIFPNPVKNSLSFKLPAGIIANGIRVRSITGAVLTEIENMNQQTINTQFLAKGMYWLELETNEGTVTKSFIK